MVKEDTIPESFPGIMSFLRTFRYQVWYWVLTVECQGEVFWTHVQKSCGLYTFLRSGEGQSAVQLCSVNSVTGSHTGSLWVRERLSTSNLLNAPSRSTLFKWEENNAPPPINVSSFVFNHRLHNYLWLNKYINKWNIIKCATVLYKLV